MGFDCNHQVHEALRDQRMVQKERKEERGRRRSSDVRVIVKIYSWFVITVTVLNYFCLTVTAAETRPKNVTSLSEENVLVNESISTSTVRPWPSHEFFQAVINAKDERPSVESLYENSTQVTTANPNQNDLQSSSVQSFPNSTSAEKHDSSQQLSKSYTNNTTVFHKYNATEDDYEIIKKNLSSPENLKAEDKAPSEHREFLFTNPDRYLAPNTADEHKNSEKTESRHWISIKTSSLPTSSEETPRYPRLSSTVSTNGEKLPFRVIHRQKPQSFTELSPEFYAKLNGEDINSKASSYWLGQTEVKGKLPFITSSSKLSELSASIKQQYRPQHDYVDDEPSHGWWQDEDKQSYVPSPTRPPDFPRITWPYTTSSSHLKLKSTTKHVDPQFQIIASSSTMKYPNPKITIGTATTSYPSDIYSELVQSSKPKPAVVHSNTVSSSHWGSLGSVQSMAIPFRASSGSKHSSIFTVTQSPFAQSFGYGPTIKISSELITTSTDTNIGEHYNSGTKHSIEVQTSSTNSNTNIEENIGSANGSLANGFKAPTNLWYKPIINHHYSPGHGSSTVGQHGWGMETGTETGMESAATDTGTGTGMTDIDSSNTPFPILTPHKNYNPATESTPTIKESEKVPVRDKNKYSEPEPAEAHYLPQIIFKLWKYSNGTLELADEQSIPSRVLKDYGVKVKEDRVLNLEELPRAIQRIVEEKIEVLQASSKETGSELPNDRQGYDLIDSQWELLPTIQQGNNGQLHISGANPPQPQSNYPTRQPTRKPVTLNYVLWDQSQLQHPVKRPQNLFFNTQGHNDETMTVASQQEQIQNYLQDLLLKKKPGTYAGTPTAESIWEAVESYFKDQASKLPSYIPADAQNSPGRPTIFPNFADKEISNLVAISLILAYLNKNKNNNNLNEDITFPQTVKQPLAQNIGSLFTPPLRDQAWDTVQPIIEKLAYNQDFSFNIPTSPPNRPPVKFKKTVTKPPLQVYNDYLENSWEETEHEIEEPSTPSPLNRYSLSMSDLNFLPNGFFKRTTTATTTTTTAPPPPPTRKQKLRPTTQKSTRLRFGARPSSSPSSVVTKGETNEDDATGSLSEDDLTKTLLTKIVKKKIKKKLKKFSKKKGWYDFDVNFDIGLDVADLVKKKVLGILALKYAPFLVLALATIGPTLMLCMPYIVKTMKHRFPGYPGGHYSYPYTYAYPVGENSYEDPNFDNGWGWSAGKKGQAKSQGLTEIHHHFHDIPPSLNKNYKESLNLKTKAKANSNSNSNQGVNPGDYSYDYDYETNQKPNTDHTYIYSNTGLSNPLGSTVPYVQVTIPAAQVTPAPQYSQQWSLFPQQQQQQQQQQQEYQEPIPQYQQFQPVLHQNPNPQSPPLFPLENYQADEYMKRIREIGRNLGKMIGSQISDVGNQDAMKVILDNKKDTITNMLEKLNIFTGSGESDDDHGNLYRRKGAHFRKRRRRNFEA